MEIRTWNSYSCNNSSSFYLVAEFESEELVGEVAKELREFFEEHAKEADDNEIDVYEESTQTQIALGKKHGFDYSGGGVFWGDSGLSGDEPNVGHSGSTLLVYHSYCGGGVEIDSYLSARGAKDVHTDDGTPDIACMFHLKTNKEGAKAAKEMRAFFGQNSKYSEFDDYERAFWNPKNGRLPYADVNEDVFFWCDGEAGGFHMPFDAGDIDDIKSYLEGKGFESYRLLICDDSLRDRLHTLSSITNCPECNSSNLKLFEADSTMPEDQMACRDCDGMFALGAVQALQPVVQVCSDNLSRIVAVGEMLFASSLSDGVVWRRDKELKWEKVLDANRGVNRFLQQKDKLIVIGHGGTIRFTTNQGKTWKKPTNEADNTLWGITETPNGTIFICGNSILMSSTDAKKWKMLKPPVNANLMDIASAGDSLYICTRDGKIYVSNNEGKTWKLTQSGVSKPLCSILALSENEVVVVGDGGIVLTTKDGGAKWTKRTTKTKADIESICQGNMGNLYAIASDGSLLYSDNHGVKWEQQSLSTSGHMWGLTTTPSGTIFVVGDYGTFARVEGLDSPLDNGDSDDPAPGNMVPTVGKNFLFTGQLATLSRAEAKSKVGELGGIAKSSVTKDLDYLVIGDKGSALFGEGKKGSKMVAAEQLIANGAALQIISESSFLKIRKCTEEEAAAQEKAVSEKADPKKAAPKKATPKKTTPKKTTPKKTTPKKTPPKKGASKKAATKTPKAASKNATPKKASSGASGKSFLFTGKLSEMSRSEAKKQVTALGGISKSSVTKDLDYLVIGDEGSPLFGGGKKGSKMVAAEKLIAAGSDLKIISETDFMKMKA